LGQQFIVDNRPGGGGIVSAQITATSPADGYTVFLTGSGGVTIAPFLAKKRPYDPVQDFAPVTLVAIAPLIMTNHPSLPVRSVKDLVGLAKARPNQLIFASTGAGSVQHLTIEKFSRAAGINVVHVPYKGGAPAVMNTVSGEAQLVITAIPPVLSHIRSTRLRALAVTSSQRSSAVPEVPTVAESGLPGFESVTWYGMFAPKNTPAAIVDRLFNEIRKAADSTSVKSILAQEGLEPAVNGPRALADFHRADIARWQKVIRDLRESNIALE
jgi:tripartite-type tricarboxylate transporter receptor subunit TctC